MIGQLASDGCRYVGIDAPGYTAYIDADSLAAMRARGEEPMAIMERSIQADNEVIADCPGVTFGIHICRGNRQSMWHREGHYDAIAEKLFNGLKHQRLLLEYDTERAGGFEPLRFVPKRKDGRARFDHDQSRADRDRRRVAAPHRRRGALFATRTVGAQPAMRLRFESAR